MPSNDNNLEEEKDIDIIHSLLIGSPFKIRPDDEKLAILEKGRPLYNLNIIKRDTSKNCNRNFHLSWYGIHKWLCGSRSYNKLFCWPCLLMRPETSSWCSTGNDDMKRFLSLATKHIRCKSHIKAISEYDETLTNFGLSPEFMNELKFTCKEEEQSLSDKTDVGDDLMNLYFQETEKKETLRDNKNSCSVTPSNKSQVTESNVLLTSKSSSKITFKTWQEMCKDNFPVSKSRFFEDFKLYKWKRKIAKQELRNARLIGEKLKLEIEVLREKIEYYKALKQEAQICGRSSASAITIVPDSGNN